MVLLLDGFQLRRPISPISPVGPIPICGHTLIYPALPAAPSEIRRAQSSRLAEAGGRARLGRDPIPVPMS
jgi:hypothetical protein